MADNDLFPYRAITMTINAMISIRLFYFSAMFIVMVMYGFLIISLKCCKGGDKASATHSNIAPKMFLITFTTGAVVIDKFEYHFFVMPKICTLMEQNYSHVLKQPIRVLYFSMLVEHLLVTLTPGSDVKT